MGQIGQIDQIDDGWRGGCASRIFRFFIGTNTLTYGDWMIGEMLESDQNLKFYYLEVKRGAKPHPIKV